METDAVLFVKRPDKTADRIADHSRERYFVRAHHVHFDFPRTK
jgi:hypothetical protein